MPPSPVKEEPKEQPELEEEEEEWTPRICTRAEFLERLARDLELRNGRESGRNDGYSIVVRAVVERREGNAVRAEFVETEGPRLAHLVDPNGGRILDWFADDMYDEEFIPMAEDPDGNIVPAGNCSKRPRTYAATPSGCWSDRTSTGRTEWLLISLMGGIDYHNKDFEETREWIEREHRSDLTQLMEEQEAAGRNRPKRGAMTTGGGRRAGVAQGPRREPGHAPLQALTGRGPRPSATAERHTK